MTQCSNEDQHPYANTEYHGNILERNAVLVAPFFNNLLLLLNQESDSPFQLAAMLMQVRELEHSLVAVDLKRDNQVLLGGE